MDFAHDELIFGVVVRVTTNAAEGLFGRVKTFERRRGTQHVPKRKYGDLLAEYLWRAKFLHSRSEFKEAGFWPLLDLIVKTRPAEFHPEGAK